MNLIPVIIVVTITLGVCFVADKGFTAIFRGKAQHKTGFAVKASKRYATFGLVIAILGVMALFSVKAQGVLMLVAGIIMLLLASCLLIYYLSFGIYYDDESFIYSSFGRKSITYKFNQIKAQQLYASGSSLVVELHLNDDRTIQLQSSMSGVNRFLDKAFEGWLMQNGLTLEDCPFHDPKNSCWFPNAQEE